MAKGDRSGYSEQQKAQAHELEDKLQEQGASRSEAKREAWRTVDEQDGGRASGYGRSGELFQKTDKKKEGAGKKDGR